MNYKPVIPSGFRLDDECWRAEEDYPWKDSLSQYTASAFACSTTGATETMIGILPYNQKSLYNVTSHNRVTATADWIHLSQ